MQGILLVNLGSPATTDIPDVKRYLDEFLMDKRVIDYNIIKRNLLIRGIILRTRPQRTSEAYKKIWWEDGSPLIVISQRVKEKLQQIVDMPVALAMRYGEPSIEAGMKALHDQGVNEIILFPMYPQYAMSSTETVVALAQKIQKKKFPHTHIHFVKPFYNHPTYIQVMADKIKAHLPASYDKIVFSYHGIPERHFYKYGHDGVTDLNQCINNPNETHNKYCYLYQSYKTTDLIAAALQIPSDKIEVTFQSRLGKEKWVEPYTDVLLEELPKQGYKNIAILCPAFVSDCLETLEEIEMEGGEEFKAHGGESYTYIPCLNEDDAWIQVIKQLCLEAVNDTYDVPMMMHS